MQVVFVGGASSVGASCLAIQLAEQWIVVDAGVRVDRKSDPLPDLSLLEGKDVKAIFVTHAHADHIGALPLLHQAFPAAPIFASRGTSLLMEVMLADALKIMTRRAVEEMELPLYPETLVASMLTQVRPIPVGESFTLPVLPGITIQTSRAGHIAGAVSFGFIAYDGSIVVSGDISSTPQRTVIGATPPQMDRCDVLVLESTYGARLHPNRQAEETRLAWAVANGLAQGGHTLIPCYGLGRGQELLLVLQAAQEKGQIPEFPIYVDGLVRRVCSTYLLIPEALTPTLQRQIRKGFTPFTGRNVTFVRDERDRERILAGPPACILSSSGMLTGGPSVWYAARIASDPKASILITGYQDEESPGKRLLDLAEKKENTLMLDGTQVEVRCQVAKYSLSAHADGAELAAYAAALKPNRVALVHGDPEARAALKGLLTNTDVALPVEGMIVEKQEKRVKRTASGSSSRDSVANPVESLPQGIGQGAPFDYTHVEELWRVVTQFPTLRIVTARELALVWYGEVTEERTRDILDVFEQDYEQRYFVRQHALEEAYRVRGQYEEVPGDFLSDLVGSVLLLLVAPGSAKPVVCRGIEPGAAVRVQLPKGVSQERTRFPFSSILEAAGPAPQEVQDSNQKASLFLANLVKTMRRIRRSISAHSLAQSCNEEALYTLGDLCEMAGLAPQSLEDRMALAKVLYQHPGLFTQQRSVLEGEGLTLYCLSPEWREALEEPEEIERPDQNWILSVIEQYLGTPSDLYKRSIDPDTGDVVLSFYFPARASTIYAEAIAAAAEETGVTITIAPHTHQGELAKAARSVLPGGLTAQGTPSIFLERSVISLHCTGQASTEEIAGAQSSFYEETGWYLELQGITLVTAQATGLTEEDHEEEDVPEPLHEFRQPEMNQYEALQLAQRLLSDLPGFYKAGADPANATLLLRFHFPAAAQKRYAEQFAQLEAQTGWHVHLHPAVHHQALVEMARRMLPEGLASNGTPSLHLDRETVRVYYQGTASSEAIQEAQERFLEETGWRLELLMPGQKPDTPQRLSRDEALTLARKSFNPVPGFYRVGADPTKGTLWLHFHFPDTARPRYMEQLVELATQTGWRVYVYPNAHEKALIAQIARLLPVGVSITGKPSVYQDTRRLSVSLSGTLNAEAMEEIQGVFTEETGWKADLENM
jgi:Cft2 family RNA processing exonuclease